MNPIIRYSKVWLVCVLAALTACQSSGSRKGFYSSPLQPGDQVEVRRDITVPAGKARVYLQQGQLTSYGGVNQYAPFCYFLLRDPLPDAQVIKPGVFEVDSVWLDQTSVSLELPVHVAGVGIGIGGVIGGDRMPIAYQFHIRLKSTEQANATLVCSGAFEEPVTAAPIRLNELREALGDYATVRVQETAPPAAR